MKKSTLAALLLTPLIFTASVANATGGHQIKVISALREYYVGFLFNSPCGGGEIVLNNPGDSAIYTTNDCDTNDNIMLSGYGRPAGGVPYCNDGQHYTPDLIDSVTIHTYGTCDVVCTDGSTTSCQAN